MSKKTVKIRRFIKTGLVLGAALAGATAPLVAAPEPFILPVDSRKLEGYTQLLEAIRTQSLLPERSDLCRPANLIIEMLNDETYQAGVIELQDLVNRYVAGDASQKDTLLEKNARLLDYLEEHYPEAVATLQKYYVDYLRASGYLDHRGHMAAQGDPQGLGLDEDGAPRMALANTNAYAKVNTIAYANIFTVVNVSVWANAAAATMLVVVAAVIGGPFFQHDLGR